VTRFSGTPRSATSPLFNVVLHEPEIPSNTGTIGRMCVTYGLALHLIHPIGFDLSEKSVRRSGLDYWPRLPLTEHADWVSYRRFVPAARVWFLCAHARRTVYDADIRRDDHLVFGRESSGLPPEVLRGTESHQIGLPMRPGERSLNLSAAVAGVAGECVRKLIARGEVRVDAEGRLADTLDADGRARTRAADADTV
jgi:tRNA (cytidine/uridine-2'-O-)-methyltransferase